MHKLLLAVIFAWAAFAQEAERAFHLAAPGNMQDIVTTLRTVGKMQRVEPDGALATVTVKGNAQELALAEWLIPKLNGGSSVQEYRVSGEDIVLVYPLEYTATLAGVQEIITSLRTVGDIQSVYLVGAPKVIPLRGPPSQIAVAKFLISEMDQPPQARESATVHRTALSGKPLTAVVYALAHTADERGLQEILTAIRSVLRVQKIYMSTAPKLLAWVDTPEMARVTEWLISELDRTAPNPTAHAGSDEMRMPGGRDDVLHVFYLAHISSMQEMIALISTLRKTAQIRFVYTNSAPPAIIVRGTADQIHLAGQLIAQKDVI